MTIEGYGRATKKGIVHALIKEDNRYISLCSKIPIDPDQELNIMQVDCGNCKRLKAYTEAIKEAIEEKPKSKKKKDITEVIIDTDNDNQIIDIDFDFDPKTIKNDMPKLREIFLDRVSNLEQQFVAQSRENGTYDIVHRLSNIIFFSPVHKSCLTSCLLLLNTIKEEWTGRTSPKQEWIESIKKLFSAGYLFAEDCIYEESNLIQEKELEIQSLKQEIEGFNHHNDALISENREYQDQINLLNDRLKIVNDLVIDQQIEINDLRLLSKKKDKEKSKIKRIEINEKPKPKRATVRRIKLS